MVSSDPSSTPEAQLLAKARILVEAGFFDENYYAEQFATQPGQDLFAHFFFHGYREGRRPNPVFDTRWYLSTYADVALSGLNPLLDYVLFGEKAGRNPSPLFNSSWYRERYQLGVATSPLMHYLLNRHGPFSPIPEFDADYYLAANPEVAAARYDPFAHYCLLGFERGRNPSTDFDTSAYRQRFMKHMPEVNPLLHYRVSKKEPDFRPRGRQGGEDFIRRGQEIHPARPGLRRIFRAAGRDRATRQTPRHLSALVPRHCGKGSKLQRMGDGHCVASRVSRIITSRGYRVISESMPLTTSMRCAGRRRWREPPEFLASSFAAAGSGSVGLKGASKTSSPRPTSTCPSACFGPTKTGCATDEEILVANGQRLDDERLCARVSPPFS